MKSYLKKGSRERCERDQAIGMLYEVGLTSREIAPYFAITDKSVTRILRSCGIPRRVRYGARSGHWRGGRIVTTQGYIAVVLPAGHPWRPLCGRDGRMLEHRFVVAQRLGRPLARTETVHHINGDKQDNRIENLQLFSGQHGNKIRAICGDCGSRHIRFEEMGSSQ